MSLISGARVDVASRLSSARASRSSEGEREMLLPATTTTTLPPPPPTTAKPKPKPVVKQATATTAAKKPATTAAPKKTTTAAPAATTPTTASARPMPPAGGAANSEEGRASWYNAKYHESNPWICAHKTIAKGQVLTVTNVNTGASITCEVGDRGPYVEGRILDLSKYAFSRLASPSAGLVWVKITWG